MIYILLLLALAVFLISPIDIVIKKAETAVVKLNILIFTFTLRGKKKTPLAKKLRNIRLGLHLLKYTDVTIDRFAVKMQNQDVAEYYQMSAYRNAALYPLIPALELYSRSVRVAEGALMPTDNNSTSINITLSTRPYLLLLSMLTILIDKIKRSIRDGKGYERADNGKH